MTAIIGIPTKSFLAVKRIAVRPKLNQITSLQESEWAGELMIVNMMFRTRDYGETNRKVFPYDRANARGSRTRQRTKQIVAASSV